ncbi:MAG: hypothetical protein M1838_005143 [Thelocarpon superellum]|nr:MAG: hypothetical protein M1838_005143 [Thelocarpon superellum]
MYYDAFPPGRSTGTHRQQGPPPNNLHQTSSRAFDPFGQMPGGMFTPDDHVSRYDTNRFDRMNAPFPGNYGYDMSGAQTWNPSGFGGPPNNNSAGGMGATGRVKPSSRQRSALPATWLDQQTSLPAPAPYSGMGNNGMGNNGMGTNGMGNSGMGNNGMGNNGMGNNVGQSPIRADAGNADPDEELIPTAIVIKNIPFAAKKEQLVQLMTDLNLPLPYAFNYHFDNGVFRGLAFANFTTAEETAVVIDHLNHFELQGRKLRVEYKKMLPLAERERIEREKRERRGQLEEQHRPMPTLQLQNQPSMSSMSSHIPATSPSPVSVRSAKPDVDLNDAQTLQFYTQLMLFKEDKTKEALIFPSTLLPAQRRTVHTLAHHLSLSHVSRGNGDQRQVHVFRTPQSINMSPPIPQLPGHMFSGDPSRRGLNRAATIDFSEARGADAGGYGTLGRQGSGLLDIPGSPGNGSMAQASQNLRAAKSFADLRSYTPSPVPSSASFPTALGAGLSRLNELGQLSVATTAAALTPTATSSNVTSAHDDSFMVNGFGALSLGGNFGVGGPNARDNRGGMASERESQQQSFGGPIGSNRTFSMGFDDSSRERGQALPMRQPRGPAPERGTGFSRNNRQNGHHQPSNTNDLESPSGVEIIVE